MKQIVLFCIGLFFSIQLVCAQELLPFVENYNKYNYQGDNQTWNVVQGADKAMYFANNHYFLRFDGVKWEKYTLPNKTIIRSVYALGNKIYTGSYKEFGYWQRENGRMRYYSLSANQNLFSDNGNEEIWKIIYFKNQLIFQSFNEIYQLSSGKINAIKLPFQISYCFPSGDRLLFASIKDGVFELKGKNFSPIGNGTILKNNVIHAIEKNGKDTYFFTQKNGVFVANSTSISPWLNPLNRLIKNTIINSAKFISATKLAIGTATKGLYIVDLKQNTYTHIHRNNSLMNNSILSIGTDNENDLWLGLDNGIAHVEINSPIALFSDNTGTLGSVYSVAKTNSGYLLASNHGIFEYQNKQLKFIPNSQGQAWNISKLGNQYLIGHNEGNFLYNGRTLNKINGINGGWNLVKSEINKSYLQATYSGVVVYEDQQNLNKHTQIKDFYKPIKYVAQTKQNEFWAADNYRGLYRVIYDENFKAKTIENVCQLNQITSDFGVKIVEFKKEILFLINQQWYHYNPFSNALELNAFFNQNFSKITDIASIDSSHFVVLKGNELYLITVQSGGFHWQLIQEKYYQGKLINDNIKVCKSGNQFIVNLDDGFLVLHYLSPKNMVPKIKIEAFVNREWVNSNAYLKYNSTVDIRVLSGNFGNSKPNLWYKLDDENTYHPVKGGNFMLSNLESGKHALVIYYSDGFAMKPIQNFQFSIQLPWYFSIWMLLLYISVIIFILYVYYRWNNLRYIQKLALHEEELKHQNSILEIKLNAENELKIKEYQKHILELEIQTKSSEVAGKSLSIAKQSEMIDTIEQILDSEMDLQNLKSKIKKTIKINSINKQEWIAFETNLTQLHNEFISRLSKHFPILTVKDIKLCIYLKMNLSSKEIAPLLNISYRGVELHRYRLRKKLKLSPEINLNKFMIDF
ncbi:MAG: histidine kinase [Flavobacterium sp.]|nr:histidine kinase [Flavobacterium sp.]